jgi:N-acetylated-alpha-linked acidic dipeptidase
MSGWCLRVLLLVGLLAASGLGSDSQSPALHGFTPIHARSERAIEERFMSVPNPARAEAAHKALTAEPHMAGSEGDRRTAEYVLDQFRRNGIEAEIEQFQVILSEPKKVTFDLIDPIKFSGPRPENEPDDPASGDTSVVVPFNAYSASGVATADVLYANYGLPADYELLRSKGISVEGKILLVRYGKAYRGVKARVAEENKVAGLIIYSDPQDDGYHAGDVYPNGPWRPPSGVQRGSVLYDFLYPGVTNGTRPRILVLPISYADARPILENVGGPVAPQKWQGGLPFTYHIGPGPAKIRMEVQLEEIRRPVWNVIARIHGTQSPEQIVLVGNHRDAWVYGGVDPNSGTTAMLEMARGLGALLRDGWHPRRSIWICSWDAEEQDQLGSTVWAERHADELTHKAVTYLNVDSAVSGDRFGASAVPSLKKFLIGVAADVPDPSGGSVLERANERLRSQLAQEVQSGYVSTKDKSVPLASEEIEVGELVFGTDFVAFLTHLGIPATDFQFEGDAGVYHSIFDNHRWMKTFGDPTFAYHVAAARYLGLQALRLANADILPLDYEAYGSDIEHYLRAIRNKLVLVRKGDRLDFGPAIKAAKELTHVAKALREKCESRLRREQQLLNAYQLNQALAKAEQGFLIPDGLPKRPWYRHAVFAPGMQNGYETLALPGVVGAIDADRFGEAQQQLDTLVVAIRRVTGQLEPYLQEGRIP